MALSDAEDNLLIFKNNHMVKKIFTRANINIINKSLTVFTALAVIFWSLGAGLFVPGVALAAVSETTAPAGTVVASQTIKASSADTPVIKFQITGNNANNTVTQVAVVLTDVTSAATTDITNFKVFKSANNVFDCGDTLVGTQTTIAAVGPATNIAVTDTIGAAASWYFVTISTSATAVNNHAFQVTMAVNAITTGGTGAAAIGTALDPAPDTALTIDTVAPTLNVNTTGPATGSTNVPVSTFVHMGFSENLDQSTLT